MANTINDLSTYGATYNGTTDASAAFQAALSAGGVIGISGPAYLNPSSATTFTVTASIGLFFTPNGFLRMGSKATLSVIGRIEAGPTQIFDIATVSGGVVTTTPDCRTPTVFPEWWGANPSAGTDCSTAMQNAQIFSEIFGGTMMLRALRYQMAATLYMRAQSSIQGSNYGSATPGIGTTLDFTTAASSASGLVVTGTSAGGTAGTIFVPKVTGINIQRTTTAPKGSGSIGLWTQAAFKGLFQNIGIDGFDTNIQLDQTSANPTIGCEFNQIVTQNYATTTLNCFAQSANIFTSCEFGGRSGGFQVIAIGGGVTCDTTKFSHCRIGNQGYAPVLVKITGGIYHIFRDCDLETSLTAAFQIALNTEFSNSTPVVTIDHCWFNDCGLNVWNSGIICSLAVLNCERMVSDPSGLSDGGKSPGSDCAIKIDDSQGVSRDKWISIKNNNIYASGNAPQSGGIKVFHAIGAQIESNRIFLSGSAAASSANAGIFVGGVSNSVNFNMIRTQGNGAISVNNSGTANIVNTNYGF